MHNALRTAGRGVACACFLALLLVCLRAAPQNPPPVDESAVIQHIDAAAHARAENIAAYTVNEHYAVFRNNNEATPVAEMTVKTTYRKESGKSFQPLSQSGSEIFRTQVIGSILDNEKRMSQAGNREGAWVTSANYSMKLVPASRQEIDGRQCLVLNLTPRRKSPYLIDGSIWVDAGDYSIVQIQGITSTSPSILAGRSQISRQYADFDGMPMATHAKAVSNSFLFGQTIVKIDYDGYHVDLTSPR